MCEKPQSYLKIVKLPRQQILASTWTIMISIGSGLDRLRSSMRYTFSLMSSNKLLVSYHETSLCKSLRLYVGKSISKLQMDIELKQIRVLI
jgi:hypothetical protein